MREFLGLLLGMALASHSLAAILPSPDEASRAAWAASLQQEQAGDVRAALAALRPLPGSHAVLLRRGWLNYLAAEHPASARDYAAALAVVPGSIEARLGLLLPLLAMGRHAEAASLARGVLRDSPLHPLASARLGTALRTQGDLDEAEQVLTAALTAYPTDVTLLAERARLAEAAGRTTEAARIREDIRVLDPGRAPVLTDEPGRTQFPNLAAIPSSQSGTWFEPGSAKGLHGGVSTYIGSLRYDNTAFKDYAWVGGINGWLDYNRTHMIEAGLDAMEITYQQLPRLQQIDVTAAYVNASIDGLRWRMGGHAIQTDDAPTDGAWVAFTGVDWIRSERSSVGVDGMLSRYPAFGPSLDVIQLSPRMRFDVAHGTDWTLRLEVSGDWIHTSRHVAGLDQEEFLSGTGRLSLYWGRWSIAGTGWAGQQAFAVRNRGYTVFNLAEEHTSGFGIEIQRTLGRHWVVGFRARRESFRETFTRSSAAESLCLGTIGFTF